MPTPRCVRCHGGPATTHKSVRVCALCRGTDWFLNLPETSRDLNRKVGGQYLN